jgi:hypothetical protein
MYTSIYALLAASAVLDILSFTDGCDVTFLPVAMLCAKKAVGPYIN